MLKEKLRDKERQLAEMSSNTSAAMTSSWHQAMTEAKRQYEAIDGALEVKKLSVVPSNFFLKFFFSFLRPFVDVARHSEHRKGLSGAGEDAARAGRDELQHDQLPAHRARHFVQRESRCERQ